jgi:hypothetical protein
VSSLDPQHNISLEHYSWQQQQKLAKRSRKIQFCDRITGKSCHDGIGHMPAIMRQHKTKSRVIITLTFSLLEVKVMMTSRDMVPMPAAMLPFVYFLINVSMFHLPRSIWYESQTLLQF